MVDSHLHLFYEPLDQNADAVIKDFVNLGGKHILNLSTTIDSSFRVLEAHKKYNLLYPGVLKSGLGIHPETLTDLYLKDNQIDLYDKAKKMLDKLEEIVANNCDQLSAIGETGLDYYYLSAHPEIPHSKINEIIEVQKYSFVRHLELAKKYCLPLSIHAREVTGSTQCVEDTLSTVMNVGCCEACGSFHSYTGDASYAKKITDVGFKIGFNAIVTYKNGENVRDILRKLSPQDILIETDAPFLLLDSVRKDKKAVIKYGRPSDVFEIVKTVAEVLDVSVGSLIKQTDANFEIVFGP